MIEVSTVTHTQYDGDGVLEAQVEGYGDDPTASPAEVHNAFGFRGRPKDPDVDPSGRAKSGSKGLHWYEGNTLHLLLLDDPRDVGLPQLASGSSMHYGSGRSYTTHDADGNAKVHVPSGKKVTIEIEGGPSIEVSSSGVRIKGVSTTRPVLVGDSTQPLPANGVLIGTPGAGQAPSTMLFTS